MAVRRLGAQLSRTPEENNWGFTHLLVTVDKFSKWIEAHPITNVRSEQATLFFTYISHRFGVSNCIITDNGTQFTGKRFLEFCDDHHIRVL
jgi:transposase InsO family protein